MARIIVAVIMHAIIALVHAMICTCWTLGMLYRPAVLNLLGLKDHFVHFVLGHRPPLKI